MCMYMYIYIYTHIYIYIYIYIHTYIHTHTYTHAPAHIYCGTFRNIRLLQEILSCAAKGEVSEEGGEACGWLRGLHGCTGKVAWVSNCCAYSLQMVGTPINCDVLFWRRSSKEMQIAQTFINREGNSWKTHKREIRIFKAFIKS